MSCYSSFDKCFKYERTRGWFCCCREDPFISEEEYDAYTDVDLYETRGASCWVYHCFTWLYFYYTALCCCSCNTELFDHRVFGKRQLRNGLRVSRMRGLSLTQKLWKVKIFCCCLLPRRHDEYLASLDTADDHPSEIGDDRVMLLKTKVERPTRSQRRGDTRASSVPAPAPAPAPVNSRATTPTANLTRRSKGLPCRAKDEYTLVSKSD